MNKPTIVSVTPATGWWANYSGYDIEPIAAWGTLSDGRIIAMWPDVETRCLVEIPDTFNDHPLADYEFHLNRLE